MVVVRVAIAGSSGSIGTQTLDVIAQSPDKFEVVALGVGSSVDVVVEQAKRWKPRVVVVTDEAARTKVAAQLPGVHISSDLADVVQDADVVVNGVVGFAGLPVTRCRPGGAAAACSAGRAHRSRRQRALCNSSVPALFK